MGDREKLSRDDWEAVIQAPFRVYSTIAAVDLGPMEAQFRTFRDEVEAGRSVFAHETIGFAMIEALAANLDVLWDAYRASDRSSKDGLKRAVKALRRAPELESAEIRDWLLVLAGRIASVRRVIGDGSVSADEARVIRDLADWLDRPEPEIAAAV